MQKIITFLLYSFLVASINAQKRKPLFPQMPGLVSYTYRNSLQKDMAATLDTIKSLGIKDMKFSNFFGKTAGDIRKMLDERGMVCSSFSVSYDDVLNKTSEVAANALQLSACFGRVALIPHQPPFSFSHAQKLCCI